MSIHAKARSAAVALLACSMCPAALADTTPQTLPFSQDWSNASLITTDDDWSGVPGIVGYRGDSLTGGTGTDPRTIVADGSGTPLDVNANETNPDTFSSGGIAEFDALPNPTVALQGSGTADAPYLALHLNTTGQTGITIAYNVRDVDGSADDAVQQVALQYRVGSSGDFTDLPAGYVADATIGGTATTVTPVSVPLPQAAENQPLVEVRIITTNAPGSDEWVGIDDISVTAGAADAAPTVLSTVPADDATDVPVTANLRVTFSEPVNAGNTSFSIFCGANQAFTVSGGPTTFTIDPVQSLPPSTLCTVTVVAANVADLDRNDPPDVMDADDVFDFTTGAPFVCGDAATLIGAIQGNGSASPFDGNPVVIEGIVTADLQGADGLDGFFVQEEDGTDNDLDPSTSDGIFVDDTGFGVDVNVGDVVRVSGTVDENFGQTEISAVNNVAVCGTGGSVAATPVTLPFSSTADAERYEGMLVSFAQTLTVTENYELGRYGEVHVSGDGRLFQPTQVALPGAPAQARQDANDLNRIVIDDNSSVENPDPLIYPGPAGLSALNTLRSGDTVTGLVGAFGYGFGSYRVQPTTSPNFSPDNARPSSPDLPGTGLRVASFNVLNYFNGNGLGGGFPTSRGAHSVEEFTRQRDKIIQAVLGLEADIIGLIEIENDGYGVNSAIADLVNGVNAAAPGGVTYAFVNPGVGMIGTDEIAVGFIYRTETVGLVNGAAILDGTIDPLFNSNRNRPALAQSFEELSSGERFTAVINHFKSKGSACTPDDPDLGDGQGNCNVTRLNAAIALADWLAADPTGSGDPDVLIMGDLNAYAMEDPIQSLINDGYVNLLASTPGAYSYVFDGQWGNLDHALASASMATQVTGATDWHINADEPIALDYNLEYKSDAQDVLFYNADPYRSSDHDPAVVQLALSSGPDPFDFVDQDVTGQQAVFSNVVRISGLSTPAILQLSGHPSARFTVNGGALQSGSTTVASGDVVRLRLVSSAAVGSRTATLSVGGVTEKWTVRTIPEPDTTPEPFDLIDQDVTGQQSVFSNPVRVAGINRPVTLTLSGHPSARVSVNGGALVAGPVEVERTDTVRVRMVSSANTESRSVILSIGGISDVWTVTTTVPPSPPSE